MGADSGSCSATTIGPAGQITPSTAFAADADEVRVDQGVRAIDLAFVAAIGERDERKRAGRAGAAHHHHFGRRGDEVQGLRGHRRVGARIALVGDDLHAGRIGGLFERVVDKIAPGVVIADIADRLDAARGHPLHHRIHHHGRRLRNEIIQEPASPGTSPVGVSAISGTFSSCETAAIASVVGVAPGAHQHVDLVLLDQLAGVARAGRRIGGVVKLNRFDL